MIYNHTFIGSIPLDEKKKYLEQKLSEEEIAEAFKRFNEMPAAQSKPATSQLSIVNSDKTQRRVDNVSSLFMQSVNVASIAILSTIGVTYVLDRIKDKKDKDLREEIKERVFDNLRENADRLR